MILVEECPAGSEMDAAVTKALGLKVNYTKLSDGIEGPVYLAGTYSAEDDGWIEHKDWRRVHSFSTNIAAAWDLVELLTKVQEQPVLAFATEEPMTVLEHGFWLGKSLLRDTGSVNDKWGWRATVHFPGDEVPVDAWAETAPLAVCRVFLKAKGVYEIEEGSSGER